MKVLEIINSMGNGGAEKFVVDLSNELSLEHEVVLCSMRPVEDHMLFPKQINQSVRFISLNKKKGIDLKMYLRLYDLIKKEKPEIVHFHLDTALKYLLPLIPLFNKVNFVHTIHSNLNDEKRKRFSRLSRMFFFSKKISFVCISKSIQTDFSNAFPKFSFYLVENGVPKMTLSKKGKAVEDEIAHYKSSADTLVFITVGRIDLNKNQIIQIQALQELPTNDCILLIIGDDPVMDKPVLATLKKEARSNIYFLGVKENISDYLLNSDCLFISSFEEGLPISVIEAMAAGLPIISTPAGGMVDLIENGTNGFLTGGFGPEAFRKEVMKAIATDNIKLKEMGDNNRHKYETHYSIKNCVNSYLIIFNSK